MKPIKSETTAAGFSSLERLVRRIAVDLGDAGRIGGFRLEHLMYSAALGWVVNNPQPHGPRCGVNIARVYPPAMAAGETEMRLEDGHWCFYAPNKKAQVLRAGSGTSEHSEDSSL